MESQAEILPFRRPAVRERKADEVYSFRDMDEVLGFCSAEILRSGHTFRWIATAAHVGSTTVSKLAHSETKQPRASTIFSVLAALGWEVTARR